MWGVKNNYMEIFNATFDFSVVILALYNLLSFCFRVLAICVLPLRHNPSVAMTWLLVILFWPIPGGLLYLTLGSTKLPRKRKERHERAMDRLRGSLEKHLPSRKPAFTEKLASISRLSEKLGHWPLQYAREMELIHSTEELIGKIVHDIDRAEHTVTLLYYIFQKDHVTAPLIKALKNAAKRGVKCYVLLDELGSKKFLQKEANSLKEYGIQIHGALPLSRLRRTPLTARFDLRNHRKLAVIDCAVGYMGSHNMTEPSYGGKARGRKWEDLTIRVTGPIVEQLEGVFLQDWYVETDQVLTECIPAVPMEDSILYPLQTVPSGPAYETQNYQRLVAAALFNSKSRVIITTPYLIPDEGLLQALEVACLNGAQVDLVVPRRSDQFLAGNASKAYYSKLMEIGVNIYLYEPEVLHAKTITIDEDLAFFGSSNFDIRSFALNFELNMVLYGREETSEVRKAQERYLSKANKLDMERWEKRSRPAKTIQGIAKLLSPIL